MHEIVILEGLIILFCKMRLKAVTKKFLQRDEKQRNSGVNISLLSLSAGKTVRAYHNICIPRKTSCGKVLPLSVISFFLKKS